MLYHCHVCSFQRFIGKELTWRSVLSLKHKICWFYNFCSEKFCGGKCPQPPPSPYLRPTLKFWHWVLIGCYTDIKFSETKVVSGKTLLFGIGQLYNLRSININCSNVNSKAVRSFFKKIFIFQKICSQVNEMNAFKISSDCTTWIYLVHRTEKVQNTLR